MLHSEFGIRNSSLSSKCDCKLSIVCHVILMCVCARCFCFSGQLLQVTININFLLCQNLVHDVSCLFRRVSQEELSIIVNRLVRVAS